MNHLRSIIFKMSFYVWTGFICVFCSPAMLFERRSLVACQTFWSHGVIFLLRFIVNVRVEARGLANLPEGGRLIAMKHQSMLDTFVMHALIGDPAFVMKQELLKIPLYGAFCKKVGMIPIDRAGGAQAMRLLMRRSKETIDDGRSVIIFPEGSRALPGEKHAYQPGVFAIYKYTKAPVVPVGVNSGVVWPKTGPVRVNGQIIFDFLPPIEPGLDRVSFLNELEERIEKSSTALLALN